MKKLSILIFGFALLISSCEITDLNENRKAPTTVPGNALFSNAQVNFGSFLHNSSVNVNIFKLIAQHWTTTTYTDEPRYDIITRTIPDNVWIEMYRDVLSDFNEAKDLIRNDDVTGEAVNQNKLAITSIMQVLAYYDLVNIFGNIPFDDALISTNSQPAYTDAQTIYANISDTLNTAINNLDPSADSFGDADVFYSGDVNQWLKFANSLKMRIGITLADVDAATAQMMIEEASPNAFQSNSDNALIRYQTSPPYTNPVWQALVQSGRDDYLPAAPLVTRMNGVNDPRRPVFFTQINGEYLGGAYGTENSYSNFSHFSSLLEQVDRPGVIMGYDEIEFIRSEAAARGFNVSGTAATHYESAIRADLEFWDVPEGEITAYLAQPAVAYATATGNYQQKIGTQKWYALFLQGLQAWTEVRRLDNPVLQAPENAVIDEYPSRFTYPTDEANLNEANYNEAASAIGGDLLTTKLFWDVN